MWICFDYTVITTTLYNYRKPLSTHSMLNSNSYISHKQCTTTKNKQKKLKHIYKPESWHLDWTLQIQKQWPDLTWIEEYRNVFFICCGWCTCKAHGGGGEWLILRWLTIICLAWEHDPVPSRHIVNREWVGELLHKRALLSLSVGSAYLCHQVASSNRRGSFCFGVKKEWVFSFKITFEWRDQCVCKFLTPSLKIMYTSHCRWFYVQFLYLYYCISTIWLLKMTRVV